MSLEKSLKNGMRWRMGSAGEWEALENGENGSRWRMEVAGPFASPAPFLLQPLSFSGPFASPAPLLLEPLHFSGPYISLATTFPLALYFSRATTSLWPLPFKRLGVLYCMESYGKLP
jgi:hypothetical protein